MVGRSLDTEFPKAVCKIGEVRLRVSGLTSRSSARHFVLCSQRRGARHGRTHGGRTYRNRPPYLRRRPDDVRGISFSTACRSASESPRDAIRHGICLLTEDRKAQGLILRASARDNFSLPNIAGWSRLGWIKQRLEQARFASRVTELKVRLSGPEQLVESLSGGNQQKLLVARWLETNSKVVIFDEPTRGIDVGAKYEMYLLINKLAAEGKAIIMISSELPELLGMCDRIVVMKQGRTSGEIVNSPDVKQETVMALAV